mgnify:FL=1
MAKNSDRIERSHDIQDAQFPTWEIAEAVRVFNRRTVRRLKHRTPAGFAVEGDERRSSAQTGARRHSDPGSFSLSFAETRVCFPKFTVAKDLVA